MGQEGCFVLQAVVMSHDSGRVCLLSSHWQCFIDARPLLVVAVAHIHMVLNVESSLAVSEMNLPADESGPIVMCAKLSSDVKKLVQTTQMDKESVRAICLSRLLTGAATAWTLCVY